MIRTAEEVEARRVRRTVENILDMLPNLDVSKVTKKRVYFYNEDGSEERVAKPYPFNGDYHYSQECTKRYAVGEVVSFHFYYTYFNHYKVVDVDRDVVLLQRINKAV